MYELLQKAKLTHRRIEEGDVLECPAGWKWLVVGGKIAHVTGTDSWLGLERKGGVAPSVNQVIVEGDFATQHYALYGQQLIDTSAAALALRGGLMGGMLLLSDGYQLHFTGGTGSFVYIHILQIPEAQY